MKEGCSGSAAPPGRTTSVTCLGGLRRVRLQVGTTGEPVGGRRCTQRIRRSRRDVLAAPCSVLGEDAVFRRGFNHVSWDPPLFAPVRHRIRLFIGFLGQLRCSVVHLVVFPQPSECLRPACGDPSPRARESRDRTPVLKGDGTRIDPKGQASLEFYSMSFITCRVVTLAFGRCVSADSVGVLGTTAREKLPNACF